MARRNTSTHSLPFTNGTDRTGDPVEEDVLAVIVGLTGTKPDGLVDFVDRTTQSLEQTQVLKLVERGNRRVQGGKVFIGERNGCR
ncbi:hypothetical protein [Spirosoma agri]|uniref:Uncharacterized protein n=1 Tax=Spirosoma agri TaxID=1987381 RepID=A0A6M0IM69_9BACT|nr:hypothetical protein [Spirosoma agri]NEU67983.1 hypothetical protein [Spirosoma agri]